MSETSTMVAKTATEQAPLDILIIGGDSMIGKALADALSASGKKVQVTTRRQPTVGGERVFFDMSQATGDWPNLPDAQTWVLCAAVSRLDACVENPEKSRHLNVGAMAALAKEGVRRGIHILFLSSDKVFDGTIPHRKADDPRCPKTEYGKQKADAEQLILAMKGEPGVVRFSKVLDSEAPLLTGWIESLTTGNGIDAFSDMTMAPVPVDIAVNALIAATEDKLSGILQVSGPEDITYADAARHLASKLNADAALVNEGTTAQAGFPLEKSPQNTTLDTRRLFQEFGIDVPPATRVLDSLYGIEKAH